MEEDNDLEMSKFFVLRFDDGREEECTEEYDEEVCENCIFLEYDIVGHPGGESTQSVRQYYCSLGFWQEDF